MKRLLLVTMMSMLVGACSDQDATITLPPSPTVDFDFTVTVEQNNFGGIAVVGTVKNTGTLSVKTCTGICMEPDLQFTFLDPQGNPVQVSCECGPRPLCHKHGCRASQFHDVADVGQHVSVLPRGGTPSASRNEILRTEEALGTQEACSSVQPR